MLDGQCTGKGPVQTLVRSSTGKCFVQALQYKHVLGSNLFNFRRYKMVQGRTVSKFRTTEQYRQVFCASCVVRSGPGKYCVQAL